MPHEWFENGDLLGFVGDFLNTYMFFKTKIHQQFLFSSTARLSFLNVLLVLFLCKLTTWISQDILDWGQHNKEQNGRHIWFSLSKIEPQSKCLSVYLVARRVTLVVAFGFLFQNFWSWWGPMNSILSLIMTAGWVVGTLRGGGDNQTVPVVIEKKRTFCTHRWWGRKYILNRTHP